MSSSHTCVLRSVLLSVLLSPRGAAHGCAAHTAGRIAHTPAYSYSGMSGGRTSTVPPCPGPSGWTVAMGMRFFLRW